MNLPTTRLAVVLFALWICFPGIPSSAREGASEADTASCAAGIQIEGNRFFGSEELLSEIDLKPSRSHDLSSLERGIDRILNRYEENGFPYCQILPSRFRISERGGLCLSFLVQEGPRVEVKEVQLEGLKTTRRKVILRELGSDLFGFFSESQMNASLRRLSRLSYIKEVEKTELLAGENPEEGIYRITLVEKRNNTFSGMLGYAPATGNRQGSFFGRMELVFDNIFGTGRMTRWSWSKKDPHSSQFFFLYREPWVFGFPPTLDLKVSQLDYDSTYLQLALSARLLFNSTQRISWGVEGGWEKTIPGAAGQDYLPDSRKYRAGILFSLDLLDRPDNPRKGLHYETKIDYAYKKNFPTASLNPEKERTFLISSSLDLNHFIPTLKRQTLHAGLHFRGLSTDENLVPVSDQFKFGGINSVRGYREEEFFGSQVAWSNVEYRFLLAGSSRLFLFADYGYFRRKALSGPDKLLTSISGNRLGFGFGLRIDSKAGLVGIDYGLGQRDNFNQGKVHFGLTNRF
ncbi:MAG: BamA/TamA family outer membrane protein [Candidatus Zixiibacteriota bacterium]|nr:MAG: BamA/TamA family outer membrane protein [candidate division Zixibacteria bacterium]